MAKHLRKRYIWSEVEGCCFCKLSPQARQGILSALGSIDALQAAVEASRCLKTALAFEGREADIVHSLLEREMSGPVLAVAQSVSYFKGAREGMFSFAAFTACKRFLLDVDTGRVMPKVILLSKVPDTILVAELVNKLMLCFQATWLLITDRANRHVSREELLDHLPRCLTSPSDRELARVALNVYQASAYLVQLGPRSNGLPYEGVERIASRFLMQMTPWETEQLLCILEAFARMVDVELDKLCQDSREFALWMQKAKMELAEDPVMKRLRRHLRQSNVRLYPFSVDGDLASQLFIRALASSTLKPLCRALFKPGDQKARMRRFKHLHTKRDQAPWSALLEVWLHQVRGTGCNKKLEELKHTEPEVYEELVNKEFERDVDGGPAEAWQKANKDAYPPRWVGRYQTEDLRAVGYVFWDKERNADRILEEQVPLPDIVISSPPADGSAHNGS